MADAFDPGEHADLRAEVPIPPTPAAAPRLARIAARLHGQLDAVTDRATSKVLESIDAYSGAAVVSRDDLWWSVHRNVELVLRALVEQRLPSDDVLRVRRELGVRRARQEFPLADLLRAFRVGYLAVWQVLTDEATAEGPEAVAELAEQAALVWGTMDAVSSAVADGYRAAMTAADVDLRRRVLALVDALREGRSEEAAERARGLEVDPGGRFTVAVCHGYHPSGAASGALVAEQADRTVVLLQTDEEAADRQLAQRLHRQGASHIGTGLDRHGVTGAARALAEAELAHRAAAALDRDVVRFREDWFTCLVIDGAPSLCEVLADAVAHLSRSPEAAGTVAAVLEANGNLTVAGRLLDLHPNGVAYRLTRIAEATGLDLRTSTGARDAAVALTLARAGGADAP